MYLQKKYFLIFILLISFSSTLFARKINLKNKKSSNSNTSLFGGAYFEQELETFKNSQNKFFT